MTPPADESESENFYQANVDQCVGARLRLRRLALGITQQRLAEWLGLPLVMIQQYEDGTLRMDAAQLFSMAQALDVPVGYFFEQTAVAHPLDLALHIPDSGEINALPQAPPGLKRELVNLLKFFFGIRDPAGRRKILDLAKDLRNSEN